MKIDLDGFLAELQMCGTDERIIRPLMVLVRHVNSALDGMRCEVEDIADARIQDARDRESHWRTHDYSY